MGLESPSYLGGLDADGGGQLEAGLLLAADFGDVGLHGRLVPEHELPLGLPSVVVDGAAEGSAYKMWAGYYLGGLDWGGAWGGTYR